MACVYGQRHMPQVFALPGPPRLRQWCPGFRRVAPRRQELLRIARTHSGLARAARWYMLRDDAGTVPPDLLLGGSVQGLYPVSAVPG